MHSAHCERYLERVATAHDAVVDASASYVTETVRVDHDPDRLSPDALADRLSRLGYTAYRRDGSDEPAGERSTRSVGDRGDGESDRRDEPVARADDTESPYRSREMAGHRKRRHDDSLAVRYVVGVVFGSFLLVPYVAIFYPVYLAELVSWGPLALYEDAFESLDSIVLPLFLVLTGAVIYLTGAPLVRGAVVAIRLRRPNAQLLAVLPVAAAYVYATMAVLGGRNDVYFDFAIVTATLVMGAIFWEANVKRDAYARLTDLTRSTVDAARRYEDDGSTDVVAVERLNPGDRILVRQGERIPVDGTLADGTCTVEEAIVTGESLPRRRSAGDAVIGGSAVTGGAAVVSVGDRTTSRLDRLTRTVWNLQSARHGATVRADAVAERVLAIVVVAAVVVAAASLFFGADALDAARASLLTVLVASPWAIAFATPVAVATTIREAAEAGIVVFDETVFDRLRAVDTVVFDKTGTLTTGEMTVVDAWGPASALTAAAALERRAAHPAGEAIADAFSPDGDGGVDGRTASTDGGAVSDDADRAPTIEAYEAHATGVGGVVDGRHTLVGHPTLFDERRWTVDGDLAERVDSIRGDGLLPVVVGRDGAVEGVIAVGDRPREAWAATIDALSDREVIVLTGDDERATDFLAHHDAVDRIFAGVSPAAKTETIRRLSAEGCVAMVGDGTNDAPALAASDLSISLGGASALAADAADLALANDDLRGVDRAFSLAETARRRRRGALALAFVYPAIAVPAAVVGAVNPLVTTAAIVATATAIVVHSSRSGR